VARGADESAADLHAWNPTAPSIEFRGEFSACRRASVRRVRERLEIKTRAAHRTAATEDND
jgi:hypothetical protein